MSSKFYTLQPGEWREIEGRFHRFQCCDCGLVHLFQFRIVKKNGRRVIRFRAWRDGRATGGVRRWKGKFKLAKNER